ncbi:MAG: hypothetical protein QHH10_10685 [Peptococcaceae bacterium]|nr:hypothetical protein [Peptococcaceae bacterium]MDH7525764.1 hypothetical protein [Peptococcaceae bacterium]
MSSGMKKALTNEVKNTAIRLGADLVGITDPASLDGSPDGHPSPFRILPQARSVVVVARRMPYGALEIPHPPFDGPIDELEVVNGGVSVASYMTMFFNLQHLVFDLAYFIEKTGYIAVPVSPSHGRDEKRWVGTISLRKAAEQAGLGEFGRHMLIITPQYGPRVFFAAVITSAALEIDGPQTGRQGCEGCAVCNAARRCPVHAINETGEGFNRLRCVWGASWGLYKGSGGQQPPEDWMKCNSIAEAVQLVPKYRQMYPDIDYYMQLSTKYMGYQNCNECLVHCVKGKQSSKEMFYAQS